MVFVRYGATEDNVGQFFFCCPLAKHTTREEMFEKVDTFTKEHQLFSHDNNRKDYEFMKNENKIFR